MLGGICPILIQVHYKAGEYLMTSTYDVREKYCVVEGKFLLLLFFCQHPPLKGVLKYMAEAIISRRGGNGNSSVLQFITEIVSANKTWTVPDHIGNIIVRIFGGGGCGYSNNYGGSGWMNNGELNLANGTSVRITIGAGGTEGNDGGTTSFGTYLSAIGGESTGDGGAGGCPHGKGYQFGGAGGAYTMGSNAGFGGDGGIWGGGGGGACVQYKQQAGYGGYGGNGGMYGGGGGGGGTSTTQTSRGGNGGNGGSYGGGGGGGGGWFQSPYDSYHPQGIGGRGGEYGGNGGDGVQVSNKNQNTIANSQVPAENGTNTIGNNQVPKRLQGSGARAEITNTKGYGYHYDGDYYETTAGWGGPGGGGFGGRGGYGNSPRLEYSYQDVYISGGGGGGGGYGGNGGNGRVGGGGGGGYGGCGGSPNNNQTMSAAGGGGGYFGNGSNSGGGGGYYTDANDGAGVAYGLYGRGGCGPISATQGVCIIQYYIDDSENI